MENEEKLRFRSKMFVGIFPIKNGIIPNKGSNFVIVSFRLKK